MSSEPVFEAFKKIPRMKRGCVITEKIDGTNAQIWISENPEEPMRFGSRNRWITPADDNFGFARWASENAEALRTYLGPGRHFGEWWGCGIQRNYGLAEKRFSLFNTGRWKEKFSTVPPPKGLDLVPVLYQGDFSTSVVDDIMGLLKSCGSIAAPGFKDPEGVVVYHTASRELYKVTLGGDGHKGNE